MGAYSNIKVGDKVRSYTKGWGKIVEVGTMGFYVEFDKDVNKSHYGFLKNGRFNNWDDFPEIIEWKSKKQKVEKWIRFYREINGNLKVDKQFRSKRLALFDSYEEALEMYNKNDISNTPTVPLPVKIEWYE